SQRFPGNLVSRVRFSLFVVGHGPRLLSDSTLDAVESCFTSPSFLLVDRDRSTTSRFSDPRPSPPFRPPAQTRAGTDVRQCRDGGIGGSCRPVVARGSPTGFPRC